MATDPTWLGPLVTHILSGVGGVAVGMSKAITEWFKERRKRNDLEDALYREFCRNFNHLIHYQLAISDNPNYTKEYPEIPEWLRRDVYDHAIKEQPVALTKMKGTELMGDAYMMMNRIAQKSDVKQRHTAAYELQVRIANPLAGFNPRVNKMLADLYWKPEIHPFTKMAMWEHQYKIVGWLFRWCGKRMSKNNPKMEGFQYDYAPYYGLLKSLWTGMYGKPVPKPGKIGP